MDYDPVGGVASFFGSGVGCRAQFLCCFDAVARTCRFGVENLTEHLGCFGEQLGGGFAGRVAIVKASLVLGVDSQPYRIILGDFGPGVHCQSILFAKSLIAEEPLAIS